MEQGARRREAIVADPRPRRAKEKHMLTHSSVRTGEPRLRVIYANKSVALGLPSGSTLGDIARAHNGRWRSIDVKLCAQPVPSFAGRG